MSELTGLAAILELQARKKKEAEERDRPKADWFKWPTGVTKANVRFLQEFDADAKGYDEKNGLILVVVEHHAPGAKGFTRRALCTSDTEGRCYACEQKELRIPEDQNGWSQKTNVYVQALVDFGDGKPAPVVISRTFGSTFTNSLIEDAVEEQSITDVNYRISKEGSGKQTQWIPKRAKGEPFDVSDVEVFPKDSFIRSIPYDDQAAYYGAVYQRGPALDSDEAPSSAPEDEDW